MRFAILHHTGISSPHYDFLIETGLDDLLLTFRLEHWPVSSPADAVRQPDHRRIYLDYEGPISRNRGQVRRIASGRYRKAVLASSTIDITLDVDPPIRLCFARIQVSQWRLSTCPPD
jgi:hypothetical protein